MNLLIVDDEPPARERLRDLVIELELGTVVGEAANGGEALTQARHNAPDLILLDIRMPGMVGLEVARHLANQASPPSVIFTTAFDSHALEAFDSNAVNYLLKPIRKQRLAAVAAVARAARLTRAQLAGLQETGASASMRTHLSASLSDRLELVAVADVRYFKVEHKYATVGSTVGELLIEDSLNTLEEDFGERFLRVHRNALVARAYVRAMERNADGHTVVRLADIDEAIEVSRRMTATVRKVLKDGVMS